MIFCSWCGDYHAQEDCPVHRFNIIERYLITKPHPFEQPKEEEDE